MTSRVLILLVVLAVCVRAVSADVVRHGCDGRHYCPGTKKSKYTVKTVTSRASYDAGTDDSVYLSIIGAAGTTSEQEIDNAGDDRVRGKEDEYKLEFADVGDFKCVKFRIGGYDGWMPEYITVYKEGTQVYGSGQRNIWLDDKKTFTYCRPLKGYSVVIKTADEGDAGTDNWIYMKLKGSLGETNEVPLQPPSRGSTDTHGLNLEDVGELKCVEFKLDGSDGWKVEQVQIFSQANDDFGDTLFDKNIRVWLDNSDKKKFCKTE